MQNKITREKLCIQGKEKGKLILILLIIKRNKY